MTGRIILVSLFISLMSVLLSATLNWHLYEYLLELDETKFSNIGLIANLPGIPIYFAFGDHLANRRYDKPAIVRRILLLLVSGSIGWGIFAFSLVFFYSLLLLPVCDSKTSKGSKYWETGK